MASWQAGISQRGHISLEPVPHTWRRTRKRLARYTPMLMAQQSRRNCVESQRSASCSWPSSLSATKRPNLLHALEADDVVDPTECLILADRRLSFETHLAVRVDVERARASAQLVPLVGDPLVRTSFRNVFGYTLAAMGHFDEALELTEDQLADAEAPSTRVRASIRILSSGARQGGAAKLPRGARVARRG